MKRFAMIHVAAAAVLLAAATLAEARDPRCKSTLSCRREQCQQLWHGSYYHSAWGMPVALVVPPTADYQTNWGWGVGNTRVTPICPQFGRAWPGVTGYDRHAFRPTPPWPSDTTQFGVYPVRGPW
jgi:hypothetical protein